MIVIEKDKGEKIHYEVDSTKICFDDDLSINLAKREEDENVHIDICFDHEHQLCIGTANARAYVAEIDIPAREYTDTPAEKNVSEGDAESEGGTFREAAPLDMDKVTLTLWAID